jgi:hypothetical protein
MGSNVNLVMVKGELPKTLKGVAGLYLVVLSVNEVSG